MCLIFVAGLDIAPFLYSFKKKLSCQNELIHFYVKKGWKYFSKFIYWVGCKKGVEAYTHLFLTLALDIFSLRISVTSLLQEEKMNVMKITNFSWFVFQIMLGAHNVQDNILLTKKMFTYLNTLSLIAFLHL